MYIETGRSVRECYDDHLKKRSMEYSWSTCGRTFQHWRPQIAAQIAAGSTLKWEAF